MFGIAGILHFDNRPVDPEVLQAMTLAVSHRGPDADGIYIDGNVGLGHRRLSIYRLFNRPAAHAGQWRIPGYFIEGEIYNYLELRTELQHAGQNLSLIPTRNSY